MNINQAHTAAYAIKENLSGIDQARAMMMLFHQLGLDKPHHDDNRAKFVNPNKAIPSRM